MSDNQNVNVNVTVNQPVGMGPMMVKRQAGCLPQLLWFVFIGWWLGALAITLAYLCFLLVLTIPIGIAILNRVPYLLALREPAQLMTMYGAVPVPQHNFLVRALYFLVIGWWFVAVWMVVAYVVCVTVIGLPAGLWMFDRVPALLTLRRSQAF